MFLDENSYFRVSVIGGSKHAHANFRVMGSLKAEGTWSSAVGAQLEGE
jgi:hypothetical protein